MSTQTNTDSQKREFKSKDEFVAWLKQRTRDFAINTIQFCEKLPKTQATYVVSHQLIKSATSTAANYRAACRARSGAEFYSKMCTVVEESDESVFWYEVIKESRLTENHEEVDGLLKEANEIVAVMVTARKNTKLK